MPFASPSNTAAMALLGLLLLPMLSLGCSHNPSARESPFSREWAHQRQRDTDGRLEKKEHVLMGNEKGPRAAIETDKKGRPRLNIGKQRGISADVDVGSNAAEVGVKYKIDWGGAKSDQPRPIPEGHRTIR
jgi:hypothetical protein